MYYEIQDFEPTPDDITEMLEWHARAQLERLLEAKLKQKPIRRRKK